MLRFGSMRVNAQKVQEAAVEEVPAASVRPTKHDVEQPAPNLARHAPGAVRRGAWGMAALAAIVLAVATGYWAAFHDRIQPGVHALGVDLGGLRPAEAQAALAARLDALGHHQPILRIDNQDITLPPGAFGEPATLASGVSAAAARAGRETPLSGLTVAMRATAGGGTAIPAPAVDEAALRAAVAALAPEVDRPAVEPQIVLERGTSQPALRVQPGRAGRRLDVDRTVAGLLAASAAATSGTPTTGPVNSGARPVVAAAFFDIPPAIDDVQIETARERAAALLARPVGVVAGGKTFALPPAAGLVERVDVAGGASGLDLRLTPDEAAFADFAGRVVQATARPAQDARLEVRGDQVVVVPASNGEAVDPGGLRDALVAGWLAGLAQIEAPVQAVPASVSTEALQPLATGANRLIAEPLMVTQGERQWTLGRAALAKLLALPAGAAPADTLSLDGERLRATLDAMAAESARPATNARLDIQDGQVVAVPGENGEAMDVAATAAAIQEALHAGGDGRTVMAAVKPVAPSLSVAQLEPIRAQAARIVGAPLALRYGAKTWTVSREDLAGMLMFGESPGGLIPYLSRTKLLEWAQPIADEVNPLLEQDYVAARAAWETRQQERAAARAAQEAAAQQPADGAAPQSGADKRPAAIDEPAPKRQWVDVPATAAAMWGQATQDTRATTLRLTADEPASTAGQPGQAAAVAAAAAVRGKWIDVNLATQTLVAYEGDWPVLTTLVSTGLWNHPTPVGTYKVFSKLVADDMRGGSYATGDYYFLPKVPYVMYFLEGGYAIHGTYWHNNFGHQMSHGCVNLPTDQSKRLFDWAPMGTTVVVHA